MNERIHNQTHFIVTFSLQTHLAKSAKPSIDCFLQEQDRYDSRPHRPCNLKIKEDSIGFKEVNGALSLWMIQCSSSKAHWECRGIPFAQSYWAYHGSNVPHSRLWGTLVKTNCGTHHQRTNSTPLPIFRALQYKKIQVCNPRWLNPFDLYDS